MGKKLAATVHVYQRDEHGNPIGSAQVFAAGSQPPAWARKEITNPKAWGEDGSPSAEEQYAAQAGSVPPGEEQPAVENAKEAAADESKSTTKRTGTTRGS